MTSPSLIMRMEKFTPTVARQIIEKNNAGNRPVTQARVRKYAADMKKGVWLLTGDTIKFGTEGQLLDGQHRLRGIMEAGVTLELPVARNVGRDAFTAIDTGKNRDGGDVLAIDGLNPELAKKVATAVRLSISYESGIPGNGRGVGEGYRENHMSNAAILAFVKKSPDMVEAAKFVHENFAKNALLAQSVLTWVSYETRRIEPTESDLFVLDLLNGTMLLHDDPVMVLRVLLIDQKAAMRKLGNESLYAAVVKAWNKRRKGQKQTTNTLHRRDWREFPRFE